MTDAILLDKIKKGLGIFTSYQDDTIQVYIDEVKSFMLDSGVPSGVLNSNASVGCILQGVNDLWNLTAGDAKYSEHFKQRLIQLRNKTYTIDKPNMQLNIYVPVQEELDMYGWIYISDMMGFCKVIKSKEFTVTDQENVTAHVVFSDGSEAEGINDLTGNRRRITINRTTMYVMPDTKYDIEQAKYIDSEGDTTIRCVDAFYGAEIELDTFYKTE